MSERIPYGAERRYHERAPGYREQLPPPTGPCHDCAVRPGELHHEGCDWEECETCGGQRIGCCCCHVCRAHEKYGTWTVCQRCIDLAQRTLVGGVAPLREPPDVSELQGILAQAIQQSERADKPGQGRVECIDFLMFATLVHATVWGPSDAPPA